MTDPQPHETDQPDQPAPDGSSTWTGSDAPHGESAGADSTSGTSGSAGASAGTTATAILESIREAVDDLAERASPTVREFGARAAEFTADAADKAAPYVRRAGDVTAEASSKLATKTRSWAAEVRAAMAEHDTGTSRPDPATPSWDPMGQTPPTPRTSEPDASPSDGPTPA